jgi:hypothetical protein
MYKGILPWSYSSLTAFETCPRRFKLTRITKQVQESQTEATLHGNEVHKALENHLKNTKPLPDKYKEYLPLVDRVKATPGKQLVEFKFALTQAFKPTEFFAKDAWCRGVIDVGVVSPKAAVILDWKTGKPKDDHDQLKLFAAVAFAAYPFINTCRTGYVWLAHNKLDCKTFQKADVAGIWQEFLPRVIRITKAAENDNFPPKPSGLCTKWCPVTNDLCEFSGKIR